MTVLSMLYAQIGHRWNSIANQACKYIVRDDDDVNLVFLQNAKSHDSIGGFVWPWSVDIMTVSYSDKIATANRLGAFSKLLFMYVVGIFNFD